MNRNTAITYEEAVTTIESLGGKPIAVEAQWDGDSRGWFLMMFVVIEKKGSSNNNVETHSLGDISLGGDIRVFHGTVPPYPEAQLAIEIGNKLQKKYNLDFFFPSPDHPDDDCPRWTEKNKAIQCADCRKLIIPTDSPYLPKDICYNCHLTREQNARIRNEEPCDDGVSMYLFDEQNNGNYEKVAYCTHFDSFPIAPFISDIVEQTVFNKLVNLVSLQESDIVKLREKLEQEIELQLESYKEPEQEQQKEMFLYSPIRKVKYKNREIELMMRFNKNHEKLAGLIVSYNRAQRAIDENLTYQIYFKKGFTYRDDSVMRFINCHESGSGKANKASMMERYKNILTQEELSATLSKLEANGCLKRDNNDEFSVTELGKKIL